MPEENSALVNQMEIKKKVLGAAQDHQLKAIRNVITFMMQRQALAKIYLSIPAIPVAAGDQQRQLYYEQIEVLNKMIKETLSL